MIRRILCVDAVPCARQLALLLLAHRAVHLLTHRHPPECPPHLLHLHVLCRCHLVEPHGFGLCAPRPPSCPKLPGLPFCVWSQRRKVRTWSPPTWRQLLRGCSSRGTPCASRACHSSPRPAPSVLLLQDGLHPVLRLQLHRCLHLAPVRCHPVADNGPGRAAAAFHHNVLEVGDREWFFVPLVLCATFTLLTAIPSLCACVALSVSATSSLHSGSLGEPGSAGCGLTSTHPGVHLAAVPDSTVDHDIIMSTTVLKGSSRQRRRVHVLLAAPEGGSTMASAPLLRTLPRTAQGLPWDPIW